MKTIMNALRVSSLAWSLVNPAMAVERVPGFVCEAQCLSVNYNAGFVVNFGWIYKESTENEYDAMDRLQRKCRRTLANAGYDGATLASHLEFQRHERSDSQSGSNGSDSSSTYWNSETALQDRTRYYWFGVDYSTAIRLKDEAAYSDSSEYSEWRAETREWDADIRANFVNTREACRPAMVDPTEYYEGSGRPLG